MSLGFKGGASGREPACQCRRHETWVQSLGREDPLEKEMATHPSIYAWRIPWTEESGSLRSIALQSQIQMKQLSTHTGEGNGNPPQYFCLENPMDRRAW